MMGDGSLDQGFLTREIDCKHPYDDPSILEFNHRSGDVIFPQVDWKEPVKVEIDHFADCIISGVKCITDSEHAARVVDILSRD